MKTKHTNVIDNVRLTGVRNNWRWPRREERRSEAASRQALYDTLPLSIKISRAEHNRGESKKELAKLRAQL